MRHVLRLVPVLAILSLLCGVAALAEGPVDLAPNCMLVNPGADEGRGRHHIKCEPFCSSSCERAVCDAPGYCKWHCEPIPGCTPP